MSDMSRPNHRHFTALQAALADRSLVRNRCAIHVFWKRQKNRLRWSRSSGGFAGGCVASDGAPRQPATFVQTQLLLSGSPFSTTVRADRSNLGDLSRDEYLA